MIGHARLATGHNRADVSSYQPIVMGDFVLAHNGTVRRSEAICAAHGLDPDTTCDSEVLALLVASAPGRSLPSRLSWALDEVGDDSPHAVLVLSSSMAMVAARRGGGGRPGHPLFVRRVDDTLTVCSRALDASWIPIPDDEAVVL